MGRQAFIAALCWLSLNGSLAVNLVLNNNISAESLKRLYRNVPLTGVYASAAPYGAYSIPVQYITAPKASASRIVPVKENLNSYLKDSYGNRYVQSSQAIPLKPSFPQQFLQLQALPPHFAQPLTAAPLHFNYKQASGTPQIIYGSHYKLPLQSVSQSSNHYGYSQTHPGAYVQDVKSFISPSVQSFGQSHGQSNGQTHGQLYGQFIPIPGYSTALSLQETAPVQGHEQPVVQTSNKATVYSSTQTPVRYEEVKNEPEYHSVETQEIYDDHKRQAVQKVKAKLKATPTKEIPIKTVVNGKKTVVNVKTKPIVPLLDISLLEPLTFDNPLVPQVQHYLPRINEATYHKLPDLKHKEEKKYQKEYVVQKTKSYDSGYIKGKKKSTPKRKHKNPFVEINSYGDEIGLASTARPTIVKNSNALDESPEITYEINTPNHKETYKEQKVSYNKETQSEPVNYSYGKNTHEEPVHYSYRHSSKEPVFIKEVRYEGHVDGLNNKNIEHKENQKEKKPESQSESEESDESNTSSEQEDDTPPHHQEYHPQLQNQNQHHQEHQQDHHEPPKQYHSVPQHKEEKHHYVPNSGAHQNDQHHVTYSAQHETPKQHHSIPQHKEEKYHYVPNSGAHQNDQHHVTYSAQHETPKQHHSLPQHREEKYHYVPNSGAHQNDQHHVTYSAQHEPPKQHHSKPQHREEEYHHTPNPGTQQNDHHHVIYSASPQVQFYNTHNVGFQPVAQFEEDIRLAAPIKVDPQQHVQNEHPEYRQQPQTKHHPGPAPQQGPQQQHSRPSATPQLSTSQNHHVPPVHIQEKTKQILIKEEKPEDDSPQESYDKEDKDEDSEEDFETAYKNAAYGFPAYNSHSDDTEKDIYNPDSYGVPRDHSDYNINHSPFQQYHEAGDQFPKSTRSNYMDTRDKTKENYFLDYSINRPDILADRYTKKVDYLKLFRQQKPDFSKDEHKNKAQMSQKYSAIPYEYFPSQDQLTKQMFAQYKAVPLREFDFSKGEKMDNSAFASRPLLRYKSNTHFVEPQFQYGFEPIAIPRLLDSELSAMASNNSPESEKPGMRKKLYKENFYIKKTSTLDGPTS